MRIQFGTWALLLGTAFAAICVGGTLPFWRELTDSDRGRMAPHFAILSPILVPMLFVAYTAGRKALTTKIVVAFAISEAVAVGTFWALKP